MKTSDWLSRSWSIDCHELHRPAWERIREIRPVSSTAQQSNNDVSIPHDWHATYSVKLQCILYELSIEREFVSSENLIIDNHSTIETILSMTNKYGHTLAIRQSEGCPTIRSTHRLDTVKTFASELSQLKWMPRIVHTQSEAILRLITLKKQEISIQRQEKRITSMHNSTEADRARRDCRPETNRRSVRSLCLNERWANDRVCRCQGQDMSWHDAHRYNRQYDEDQHSTSEVFPLREVGAANEMRIRIGLHGCLINKVEWHLSLNDICFISMSIGSNSFVSRYRLFFLFFCFSLYLCVANVFSCDDETLMDV